jgi:tRNA(Ile)-lysidine synthase
MEKGPANEDATSAAASGGPAAAAGRWAALEGRVASELRKLAPRATRLVVAVSGGGDSVAALRLLKRAGFELVAAHYDHRLRPESGEDALFVRRLCERLEVPLMEAGADVAAIAREKGWNLEDAARRLRYSFLYGVLAQRAAGGAIVVAHTVEDQAETVLLQLMRGAAYPVGMSPRQRGVVRPLLGERREVLRAYLEQLGESWREDATNATLELNRAWVRNHLLPQMEERFPDLQRRLADTATIQQEAKAALTYLARKRFPAGPIRLAAWQRAPSALRKTALVERLQAAGAVPSDRLLREVDARAMRAAAEGASAAPWRVSVPGGGEAALAYGELLVRSGRPSAAGVAGGQAAAATLTVSDPAQLPLEVDPGVLERYPSLELRPRRSGDRIRMPGGRKLLSDLLIDLKVPRSERGSLRVLAADQEVLWVEGIAVAEGAGATGTPALLDSDRRYMRKALAQAALAQRLGEVPIGAVVVSHEGEVLAAAHNLSETNSDPTAHAELLALQLAGRNTGDWRLAGATLYVTLEPCPMCLGAALQTHLARIVYGATNPRDGALGGVTDLAGEGWKRVPVIKGGVEAGAAGRLLRAAFEARRDSDP